MHTNQLAVLTPDEISACMEQHANYCRDNPDAPDWQARFDRAQEWAMRMPDCPLEQQVEIYEATP